MSLKRRRDDDDDDDDFKEDSDDGSPFSVNDDDDDDVVGDFINDDDDENENVAEVEFGHVRNLLPPSAKKPRLHEPVHSESSPAGSHNYQALKLRARTTLSLQPFRAPCHELY